MEESLMELYKKDIKEYEVDFLEGEEKENVEKALKKYRDRLYYKLEFNDKASLMMLENCYKQLLAQMQREAYIKGFVLAVTYKLKNDK